MKVKLSKGDIKEIAALIAKELKTDNSLRPIFQKNPPKSGTYRVRVKFPGEGAPHIMKAWYEGEKRDSNAGEGWYRYSAGLGEDAKFFERYPGATILAWDYT